MKLAEAQPLSQMEQAVGMVPTHDEAMKFRTFRRGVMLHEAVLAFWNNSTLIKHLNRPAPYCIHSKGLGAWNFSWKCPEDEIFNEETNRASKFYSIHPSGQVLCREFPADDINIDSLLGLLNLAAVIVSDCLEIPLTKWDVQTTAEKVAEQLFGVEL